MKKLEKNAQNERKDINEKNTLNKMDNEESRTSYLPLGMCFGMALGMIFGIAFDNLPIGLCVGVSMGPALGTLAYTIAKSNKEKKEQ